MLRKFPKNDRQFSWTNHVKNKMLFYNLSEQKIRSVFRSPTRVEEGVAPNTAAAMHKSKTRKTPEEVWIMYQTRGQKSKMKNQNEKLKTFKNPSKITMISAWRYPGVSRPGMAIPIPDDILEELDALTREV